MVAGPLIIGVSFLLYLLVHPGVSYWTSIFPAAILCGAGLCLNIAPLTSTAMGSVPARNSGIASAINNATSRVAGLLSVAGLGAVVALSCVGALDTHAQGLPPNIAAIVRGAGLSGDGTVPKDTPPEAMRAIAESYTVAFHNAMLACAILAFASALVALVLIEDPKRAATSE